MSTYYDKAIKTKAIQDFLSLNSRAPSREELVLLLEEYKVKYASLESIGFYGSESQKIGFKDASSSSLENQNRQALVRDLQTVSEQTDNLLGNLESSMRGLQSSGSRVSRLLTSLEARLNNLILISDKADAFWYGLEEEFNEQDKIIFSQTTATVDNGFVTLGRAARAPIGLETVTFSADVISSGGPVSTVTLGGVQNLRAQDGATWDLIAYSNFRRGRVTARLDMDFSQPTYVSAIRMVMKTIAGTSQVKATMLYSLDGTSMIRSKVQEETMPLNLFQFELGVDKVKKVTILLSKDSADTETDSTDEYAYMYSFDMVEILGGTYTSDKQSEIVLGPYEFTDTYGIPVNFSRATLEACVFVPDNTSANFFLSKDGESWISVAHNANALAVAAFGSDTAPESVRILEGGTSTKALITDPQIIDLHSLDVNWQCDAILNTALLASWYPQVVDQTILVHRGVPSSTSSGWVKTPNGYKTTILVSQPEGMLLDLGATSALINGHRRSGLVTIASGYSTFETSDSNWYPVATGLASEKLLRSSDPLYPNNHKYLIEGYGYVGNFQGQRVYQGANAYFKSKLTYVTPERFESGDSDYNYDIFTIASEKNGDYYFLVKVDKTSAAWQNELIEASWKVRGTDSNQLYVKIVLHTSSEDKTPRVDSFKLRVI
jgi:hypothetical protein